MRRILRTVLFLAVLCLTGCSSEDPQSVAFTVHEAEVDCKGTRLTIGIQANCPWTITDEAKKTITDQKIGTGSITTQVTVFSSSSYDDQTYRVTVTSEDGSSSDVLTIRQKAKPAILADNIGLISEEGGTFTIPVKTNDNIVSVDTPEWMTYTSSRGLTGYTYVFMAEQNKTGSVRIGTIKLNGKENVTKLEVTQDSYAPASVHFEYDPSYVTKREFNVRTFADPEYADLSKLRIETSEGCTATIEDGYMNVKLTDYGEFSISMLTEEKEVCQIDGECVPPEPFQDDRMESYLGQNYDFIRYWYFSPKYQLQSSNPEVLTIGEGGIPHAIGIGTTVVSVKHPDADCYDELIVEVKPFLLEARIGWTGENWDGTFDVQFAAKVTGPIGMTCDGFIVTDNNSVVRTVGSDGIKSSQLLGYSEQIYTIATGSVNVSRDGYSNINEALIGYQITVQASIGGTVYQRTIPINTKHVSFY